MSVDGLGFREGAVDAEPGVGLIDAMRQEIAGLYAGLLLDGPGMPAAGAAELGPPHGAFLVGWVGDTPVCCGGVKAKQAYTLIRKLIAGFRAAGLKKGDVVCIHAFNSVCYHRPTCRSHADI